MSLNNASGVRNLRAMFENKASSDQSTSPPSRGRSPLDTDNLENSRPLSKVRASFVAIERPGQPGQAPQWGLRKASDVSSTSGVNGSITEDSSLKRITSRNTTMAGNDHTARGDLGLILKGSPFEDDKAAHAKQAKDLEQAQKKIPQINTKKDAPKLDKTTSPVSKMKTPTSATKPKPSTAQLDTSKTGPSGKGLPTRQVLPKTSEKSPVSPQSPHTAKVNTTHPTPSIRGVRGGPAKIMAVMESATKAKLEREKKATEAKPSQTAKKDAAPKAPVTNGDKKEPTQPTKVPAAATAPTASSIARTDGPATATTSDNRRVSAVRKDKPPPKVASTSTASSLAKRTPRNSLAPQTNGHERPKSRVSTAKDESFLARMTRPTASSQKKVHDKVTKPESPPRARKVSDKVRHSLGPAKEKGEDRENDEASPLEATKSNPQVEEQKVEFPADTAVAQEAT